MKSILGVAFSLQCAAPDNCDEASIRSAMFQAQVQHTVQTQGTSLTQFVVDKPLDSVEQAFVQMTNLHSRTIVELVKQFKDEAIVTDAVDRKAVLDAKDRVLQYNTNADTISVANLKAEAGCFGSSHDTCLSEQIKTKNRSFADSF